MSLFNYYECPECDEWVSVPLGPPKYVTCSHCKSRLEIHPEADFSDNMWHDRTTLSVVDPELEHMKAMLNHLQK